MSDARLIFGLALVLVLGGTLLLWIGVIGLSLSAGRTPDSLTALQAAFAAGGAALTARGIQRIRCQPAPVAYGKAPAAR